MNKFFRVLLVIAAGLWLVGCQQARDAYVLTTTNTLVKFKTNDAGTIDSEVAISGLDSGDMLLQIDFRPSNKLLYGLTSAARIVTINTGSGVASYVGTTPFTTATLVLPVMDINPVGNYMRVIDYHPTGNTTFNGRINLDTGVLIQTDGDGTLSFKTGDTHEGEVPQLVALAHTNSNVNATQTTLYGLELNTQTLVTISTAGVLTTVTGTSRGFTVNSGFDIVPDNDLSYVAVNDVGSNASFYGIALTAGTINNGKTIGGNRQIKSLAVVLDKPKANGFNL
jgi:hypothetical protein